MKKLELQNFGVQELDTKEMNGVDGGRILLGAGFNLFREGLGAVGGFLSDLANGFKDGFKDGVK